MFRQRLSKAALGRAMHAPFLWTVLGIAGCTGAIDADPVATTPAPGTTTGGVTTLPPAEGTSTTGGVPADEPQDTPIGQEDPLRPVGEVVDELCAAQGDELRVGRTLLRRMTRTQYDNTVRDLIGVDTNPSALLAPDETVGPFFANSRTPITDLLVQQHQEIAMSLATDVVARMTEVAGCDLATGGATCVTSFVQNFGMKAFRRPLEQTEIDGYVNLFNVGAEESVESGFRLVVETMLQSPFFLYLVDVGQDVNGAPNTAPPIAPAPLTGYELASRLSYFLWDTMPDDELFTLASTGELLDATVLQGQVTRMLGDPRVRDSIPSFHLQWLRIGDMSLVEKDTTMFPNWSRQMADAMIAETGDFADYVIRQGDGLMSTLFTATYSPMQSELFPIYGMAEPAGFTPGQLVELDPGQRAGILTRAAFLAAQAHQDQTSPVHRGMAVRENLLCQPLQPPPANVNNVAPAPTEATSTRERFAQHSADPSCAGCHQYMDPIGLGFENYDPIGAYRDMDGGQPVDATGEIIDAMEDTVGPFTGAVELSQKLGNSQQVADCMANQWFRYALGRVESNDDACALKGIYDGFTTSGRNIREMIVQIVLSDAFRNVRSETQEAM